MEYRSLFVLTLCTAHVAAVSYSDLLKAEWDLYKTKFQKSYSIPFEDYARFRIYMQTKSDIIAHNKLFENGEVTYEMGFNQFSDMKYEEFASQMTGYRSSSDDENEESKGIMYTPLFNVTNLPTQVDWRKEGAVNPVANQGQCGSCWAFSAAGALEGQHFRKTGKLVQISEQNLLDCTIDNGNHGCDGGTMEAAYTYVHQNGGVDSDKFYPYKGVMVACRYKKKASVATCSHYYEMQRDEELIKEAVATVGPISVGIFANKKFQKYYSGIFSDKTCPQKKLNHAVLIVGYGTENGRDYWLVKNSYGKQWGEKGYIRILRGVNTCGIAQEASYPAV